MIHDLYIGDSSDDDEKLQDIEDDQDQQNRFAISTYLISKGKALLDSVRPAYRAQKLELRESLRIPDIEIDKSLFGDYILYKNQVGGSEELPEMIASSKGSLEAAIGILDASTWKHANQERLFFQEHFIELSNAIKNELFKLFTGQEHYPEIYNILQIEQGNTQNFLVDILMGCKLFKGASNFLTIAGIFRELLSEEEGVERLRQDFSGRKYYEYRNHTSKDFLLAVIEIYLNKLYLNKNSKPISTIYAEYQQLLNIDLSEVYSLHLTWSGTDLEETYSMFLKAQEEDLDLRQATFLIELINFHNSEINRALLRHRPSELFNGDFLDNLTKFLLEHRILRSKIKEQGIKHEKRDITHNKYLPLDQTDEKVSIYATGARSDQRFLRSGDSYEEIAEKIISIGVMQDRIKNYLIAIINGNESFLHDLGILNDNKVYLYKLADLLFNLETERNISAFVTNAMFFDLVADEHAPYTIANLPDRLPMAMSGAVDVSRYAGEHSYLIKKHKFDYKQSEAKIWDFLEFDIKNCQLLFDWIVQFVSRVGDEESIMRSSYQALANLWEVAHNTPKIKLVLSEARATFAKKRKSVDLQDGDLVVEIVDDEKQEPSDFQIKINELLEFDGIIKAIAERINQSKLVTEKHKDFVALAMQSITPLIEEQYSAFAGVLELEGLESRVGSMMLEWYPGVKVLGDQFAELDLGNAT